MNIIKFTIITSIILSLFSCSNSENNSADKDTKENETIKQEKISEEGIGPYVGVKIEGLDKIDEEMASKGLEIFKLKCSACHKMSGKRYVGPSITNITKARNPNWIMNMLMNPIEMTKKDPIAKSLFRAYNGTQMTSVNMTNDDARAVFEFLRKNDAGK